MPKNQKPPISADKQETALNKAEKQLIKIQKRKPPIARASRKKGK